MPDELDEPEAKPDQPEEEQQVVEDLDELTFVAGCTNGYIYYAPTAEQLRNVGGAQEDSDCLLAPPWQALFEGKAAEMVRQL